MTPQGLKSPPTTISSLNHSLVIIMLFNLTFLEVQLRRHRQENIGLERQYWGTILTDLKIRYDKINYYNLRIIFEMANCKALPNARLFLPGNISNLFWKYNFGEKPTLQCQKCKANFQVMRNFTTKITIEI